MWAGIFIAAQSLIVDMVRWMLGSIDRNADFWLSVVTIPGTV